MSVKLMTVCANLVNVRILTAVSNVFAILDIKASTTGNGASVRMDLELGIFFNKHQKVFSWQNLKLFFLEDLLIILATPLQRCYQNFVKHL